MKRLLSLTAACALLCAPAFGQESVPAGNYPEFSIITRIDAQPFTPYLYTLLDGNLGEHLSYSFSNCWINDDIPALYANTLRADEMSWCQWAYLSLNLGNWHIQAGKNYIFTGGFEVDAYDFDQYWQMTSNFWNNLQVYQWGGALQYVTPSESDTFSLQILSSPFSARPFEDGLLSKSLEWRGEHGPWSSIWSVSAIGYGSAVPEQPRERDNLFLLSLGNQFEVSETTSLGFDYIYRIASPFSNAEGAGARGPFYGEYSGHNLTGRFSWRPLDWLEMGLKGVFENCGAHSSQPDLLDIPEKYLSGALWFQFYPLPERDDLRIHAFAGTNNQDGFYWSAGVTYNFPLTRTLLNRRAK